MMTNAGDKEIRRYLLGGLDEGARQEVERRLLTEEDFFEELLFVEEELTDQYLNEELSADERRGFEGHFLLTPERQRKLRFAKALGRYVAENSSAALAKAAAPPQRLQSARAPTFSERVRAFWGAQGFALRTAAAFAALVLVVGTAWLFFGNPAPRTFVAINLSPSAVTRGGGGVGPEVVRLAPGADALKVNLTLPGGAAEGSRFSVGLEDERGPVERLTAERLDARTISVVIPSSLLKRGRYTLKVFETGADGAEHRTSDNYRFDVE